MQVVLPSAEYRGSVRLAGFNQESVRPPWRFRRASIFSCTWERLTGLAGDREPRDRRSANQ